MKIGNPSCVEGKARFRMIYFMNRSPELRRKIFDALPFDLCHSSEEGGVLLEQIKECAAKKGAVHSKCWKLIKKFRFEECFNPEVEQVFIERLDRVDGDIHFEMK